MPNVFRLQFLNISKQEVVSYPPKVIQNCTMLTVVTSNTYNFCSPNLVYRNTEDYFVNISQTLKKILLNLNDFSTD